MAKLKPNEKRIQLSFQRPDDLRLFSFMEKRAYECRWDLPTFVLASLQEAFKGQIDDAEVEAIAEEAARRVRERSASPPEPSPPVDPPPISKVPMADISPDDAYEQALKQVAALNYQPMKSRGRGEKSPKVPPALEPSKKG